MRRVHGKATECVVFIGRQRNAWEPTGWVGTEKLRHRVHREPTSLDGTADRNEAWRTAERRKRPCVRPAMVETGSCSSGGIWRTAKRRKRTSYGQNGGPVDREECGVPQNGGNGPPTVEKGVLLIGRGVTYRKTKETDLLRLKRGSCSSGGVWRTAKRDSMGSCSTTPPRAPLHHLLFILPSTPRGPVHPPLHHLLFIQPSTTPRGPVHPEATPPLTVHPTPPNAHCSSQRQHRLASVSSSSEGITRSGSVNIH